MAVQNPWSSEFWNLTEQGAYIKKYGIEVAKGKARQAGTSLGAPVINRSKSQPVLVLVQRRNLVTGGSVTVIGGGSSGNGPPS